MFSWSMTWVANKVKTHQNTCPINKKKNSCLKELDKTAIFFWYILMIMLHCNNVFFTLLFLYILLFFGFNLRHLGSTRSVTICCFWRLVHVLMTLQIQAGQAYTDNLLVVLQFPRSLKSNLWNVWDKSSNKRISLLKINKYLIFQVIYCLCDLKAKRTISTGMSQQKWSNLKTKSGNWRREWLTAKPQEKVTLSSWSEMNLKNTILGNT